MDNSIKINRYIQYILEHDENVMSIVGNERKIFALQQPESITYPFIVYQRNSLYPQYTKDYEGWMNTCNVEIACVSNDYIQSLDLANAVRHAIEWYRWKDSDIYIHPIKIDSINEYIVDSDNGQAYVQSITTNISIEPISSSR